MQQSLGELVKGGLPLDPPGQRFLGLPRLGDVVLDAHRVEEASVRVAHDR